MACQGRRDDPSAPWGEKGGQTSHGPREERDQAQRAHRRPGVPIGLAVDSANRHDCKMTREPIAHIAVERPDPTPDAPQGMWLDKGYDENAVRELLTAFGFTAPIR